MKSLMSHAPHHALLIALVLGSGSVASPVDAAPKRDDATLRRALTDELNRSMKELVIAKESRPYFLAYGVTDEQSLTLSAVAGAITYEQQQTDRDLSTSLRVGDPKLDNSYSGMVSSGRWGNASSRPSEDDYQALRREFWLLTDGAYKQALEQYNKKKRLLAARPPKKDADVLDFSPEPKHELVSPAIALDLEAKRSGLRELVTKLSAQLAQDAFVRNSLVGSNVEILRARTLTSEGSYRDASQLYASLMLSAITQADDGMWITAQQPFATNTIEGLPSYDVLAPQVTALHERLKTFRVAELPKAGTAIVLLEPEATSQLLGSVLADSLSGAPPPKFAEGDRDDSLAAKLNTEVISPLLSLYDDPTATQGPKQQPLWGHYLADEEVVPAQRVSLIDKGILKTLLMSRAPRKELQQSNGHYRNGGIAIGNLFLTGSGTKSRAKLLELARKTAKKDPKHPLTVYVVRRFAPRYLDEFGFAPTMTGTPTLTEVNTKGGALVEEAYRIDGNREVPVRGLMLESLSLRTLKDVLAVGDTPEIVNYRTDSGNHTAIVAPALLINRVDTRPQSGELPRLPAYPAPKQP